MTFSAYHQYTTNKFMELNNEKLEIQYQHKILNDYFDKFEKVVSSQNNKHNSWWWYFSPFDMFNILTIFLHIYIIHYIL